MENTRPKGGQKTAQSTTKARAIFTCRQSRVDSILMSRLKLELSGRCRWEYQDTASRRSSPAERMVRHRICSAITGTHI